MGFRRGSSRMSSSLSGQGRARQDCLTSEAVGAQVWCRTRSVLRESWAQARVFMRGDDAMIMMAWQCMACRCLHACAAAAARQQHARAAGQAADSLVEPLLRHQQPLLGAQGALLHGGKHSTDALHADLLAAGRLPDGCLDAAARRQAVEGQAALLGDGLAQAHGLHISGCQVDAAGLRC